MMYPIANLLGDLSRTEHLTDRNIAERLSVTLEQLHAVAAVLRSKGVIIAESAVQNGGLRHVTWHLKHGHDLQANIDFARSVGVDVDAPLVALSVRCPTCQHSAQMGGSPGTCPKCGVMMEQVDTPYSL
ncbi:MAG TPA: hypothetical protein VK550_34720 [Polyangiaceae bacterium]|nr:hypothetical protein [Polyangiaceae bacterium]